MSTPKKEFSRTDTIRFSFLADRCFRFVCESAVFEDCDFMKWNIGIKQ